MAAASSARRPSSSTQRLSRRRSTQGRSGGTQRAAQLGTRPQGRAARPAARPSGSVRSGTRASQAPPYGSVRVSQPKAMHGVQRVLRADQLSRGHALPPGRSIRPRYGVVVRATHQPGAPIAQRGVHLHGQCRPNWWREKRDLGGESPHWRHCGSWDVAAAFVRMLHGRRFICG